MPDVEVDEVLTPGPHFGPEHKGDLWSILSSEGNQADVPPPADTA
jgi:hypothetical protein